MLDNFIAQFPCCVNPIKSIYFYIIGLLTQFLITHKSAFENKHNKLKNLNWSEANQLPIYKRDRAVATLPWTENKSSSPLGPGMNSAGASKLHF